MFRSWSALTLALVGCYEPPPSEVACGQACVQTCPEGLACVAGRCTANLCPAPDAPPTPISFVQIQNRTEGGTFSTRDVVVNNQRVHDLLVVVVGWNSDVGTVLSVTDSLGLTYHLAIDKQSGGTSNSQALYYAYDIPPAATNTVIVSFSEAVKDPDIRVVEYAGIRTTDPLDGVAGMTGTAMTSSSGPITTAHGHDLIFAANTVANSTTGPGPGFQQRQINNFSDLTEDRTVFAAGMYDATAPLDSMADWVMQAAAFMGE